MPEPQTPAAPQAGGDPATPPAPGGPATTPSEPQAGDDQISLDEARKLRKEAQALRQRLKGYEDAEAAAQAAQLTEVERYKKLQADLEAERDQLAAQLHDALVYQDVARLASKFNFIVSADTLAKMLLLDDDAIEFEEGKPTNIEKLLDKLAKREQGLIRQEPQPGQPTRPGAPAVPAMNPGRSSIQQPGQLAPGQIPTWNEAFRRPR